MNIEQNSNMQELTEEEYTKVYAGMMSYELFPENNVMTIQPFNPSIKPKPNLVYYLWQIAYIAGKETVAALAA